MAMKYAELDLGKIEAVFNKLGGIKGAEKFLRGDLELIEKQIPDINLEKAYELLSMQEEYKKAKEEFIVVKNKEEWKFLMLKGLTCPKIISALKKAGSEIWQYVKDLDKDVTENDRDPNRDGNYIVGFKATVEADEENKNLSANQLREQNHKGITLMERLLLELVYFLATGEHLDVKNWTLCSGSRNRGGGVPSVGWSLGDRRVYVLLCDPDPRNDDIRPRSVVSLQTESR